MGLYQSVLLYQLIHSAGQIKIIICGQALKLSGCVKQYADFEKAW